MYNAIREPHQQCVRIVSCTFLGPLVLNPIPGPQIRNWRSIAANLINNSSINLRNSWGSFHGSSPCVGRARQRHRLHHHHIKEPAQRRTLSTLTIKMRRDKIEKVELSACPGRRALMEIAAAGLVHDPTMSRTFQKCPR